MIVHLLRHGAVETPNLLLGHTNAASTPAGIAACVRRAEGLPFTRLITSDLSRAAQAAHVIAEAKGLHPTLDRRWRELDFGAWEGKAPSQIDPQAMAAFWDDPDQYPPPHGERWSALTSRVGDALAELHNEETLIVTHGGAMRAAIAYLCGLSQGHTWAIDLPYAALLSFKVWPGEKPSAQIIGLRT